MPKSSAIHIVRLTPDRYSAWNDFCQHSGDSWFWHTSDWLEYILEYQPAWNPVSLSFLCECEGRIEAICPLVLETHEDGTTQFSYGGDAVPAPAFANGLPSKHGKEMAVAVFEHIDLLARDHNVQRAFFRASPPAPNEWQPPRKEIRPMTRFGYLDISLATQIVDLSPDEPALLRDMRKGHRAAIKQADKVLSSVVFDKLSINDVVFDEYRLLHAKAAGRVTRPLSTFQMMRDWIRQGYAILSCAYRDGTPVGFALVSVYKGAAYYSSGCEDPEHNRFPIGHLIQWRAIQWLKQNGVRLYELGVQHFHTMPHAIVSEKEINISMFKRGFGGVSVPFWRGERFYEREFCENTLSKRTAQFCEQTFGASAKASIPPLEEVDASE
jgi:hypothetical protein